LIGVITSPTGAVIRDILHRLADRFPTRVILWPVRVQGETAADEVTAAIQGFNAASGTPGTLPRPDLLIVARGGGSLEDLWPFNEEIVVRAVAASRIPLISAVGHETDWTLIDFAADKRAPTPTAAAELAVPVRSELIGRITEAGLRVGAATQRVVEVGRREYITVCRALPAPGDFLATPRRSLDELGARLSRSLGANAAMHRSHYARATAGFSPANLSAGVRRAGERLAAAVDRSRRALLVHAERKQSALSLRSRRIRPEALLDRLRVARQRLRETDARRTRALRQQLNTNWQKLESLDKLLDAFSLSKESILARGYALVHGADGEVISTASAVPRGGALELEFSDGRVAAVAGVGAVSPKRPRRRTIAPAEGQGNLFDT
jgi:exodeoxyribonuclease VII large subunit